jgi:heat shock protein HslJ
MSGAASHRYETHGEARDDSRERSDIMSRLAAALCVAAVQLLSVAARPATGVVAGPNMRMPFEHGMSIGHPACNTFRAPYAGEGNRIKIGPVAATRRVCSDNKVTVPERELLDSADIVRRWSGEPDLFEQHRPDRTRALPITSRQTK